MLYTSVHHIKFIRNQNVDIHNFNNIMTIKCKQETSTPGIRLNNIEITPEKLEIIIDIELNNEQIILWIQHVETRVEQKFYLTNGINIIPISYDEKKIVNIGLFFSTPKFGSTFKFKNIKIQKKEDIITKPNIVQKTLLDLIDHTYVINLEQRKDRLFRVKRYLKNLGINYERFNAYQPTQEEFEKNKSQITTVGALGCIHSHINVLKDAINKKYSSILILEDDIVPQKELDLKNIKLPEKWDIIYFGGSQYNFNSQQLHKFEGYYKANHTRGTFAYLIKNYMFQTLVDLFSKLEMNVDMYLEEIQNKYECFVIHENFMIADLTDSDISKSRDIEEYGKIFGWDNRKYYKEVSVIIPIYNGANYLLECLESIKTQTFNNFELIIVNDGSTDQTETILEAFFNENPKMTISYIKHEINKGLPSALNSGLLNSHGLYITWISHDNKFHRNALELMRNYLHHNDKMMLVTAGHENFGDNNNRVYGKEYTDETIITQFHGVASFMFTREVIKRIGLYDEELFGVEDYDYLIRILEQPPKKSGFIIDILSYFRRHDEQLTKKITNKYPELKTKLFQKRCDRLKLTTFENIMHSSILSYIDKTKNTIVYPPIVKYDILFQRPHQILKHMTHNYNCIFITSDNLYEKYQDNVIILSWNKFYEMRNHLLMNQVFLYYTDPRAYEYINKIKPDKVIFDLIDNPVGEFSCWNNKLFESLDTADIITYSSKYLETVIQRIYEKNQKELKKIPIYLPNGCERNFSLKIENEVDIPEQIKIIKERTNKKIIGYYGAISTWLDYDLINYIANNENIHIVMIGLINDNKKYNMKNDHHNITWLNHQNYNDIPKYLKSFDICMIPFLESEMMLGCNPLKLYEYMSSHKPIISTIKFSDYPDNYYIINQLNVFNVINRILDNNIYYDYPDIPYWDTICDKLEVTIIMNTTTKTNLQKRCAYVTNMLVDWKTLQPRFGGGERYSLNIAQLLKEHNIQVHFYQMAEITTDTEYYGFPVHCIDMKGLEMYQEFNIGYSEKVNEIIVKEKYDFVIYGMPEMCCSKNIFPNSISINHGIWFDRSTIIKDKKWFELMETHVRYPMINVSVDTNFVNFIRTMIPEFGNKLNYIPNFYEPEMYKFIEGRNNDKLTIVIPRRANIYRGSRLMNDILANIPYDVNIIWVGKGDHDDNQLLEKLEKTDKRFKFTGCSFDEMFQYYEKADIVVIPTVASEGTSLSCIEAMACGCAVVSTNVGGLCNLVLDNFNGLLVQPTAIDIASAINKLIQNSDLRKFLIQNAKEIIKEYRLPNWKNKWIQILEKVGWICQDKDDDKKYEITFERDEIEKNFKLYWKNYVHYYELQQKIKTIDEAYQHFQWNIECQTLKLYNPNLKIAVFTRHAINGGVESIIAEEAKYMNIDVYITNGLIDNLNPFLFNVVKDIDEILQIIHHYDIIIYHWLPEFAVQAIKLSHKPAIEYLHRRDTDNNDKNVPIHILTHSPFLVNHCFIKFNKYQKSCQLIEHPINLSKFHPENSDKKYIGCFCTYNQIKGIDILLKALYNVGFRIPSNILDQYQIVFYGKDTNGYKECLQKMAKDLNLKCIFNDSVNTWEYIKNYKLMIIPSRVEGLPVVLLEALACNIPVIISDLEGVVEFGNIAKTRGYENLFQTFKSEDVQDLTQKIYEWMKVPYENKNGSEYIEKYYSTTYHCNKLSNILEKYVHRYNQTEKIISSELKDFEFRHVKQTGVVKLETINDKIFNYNNFLRITIVLTNVTRKIKEIEVLLDTKINNIIPLGYQFDIFKNNNVSYIADTVVVTTDGLKSICTPELNLENVQSIQINLRPNVGDLQINDIKIISYY